MAQSYMAGMLTTDQAQSLIATYGAAPFFDTTQPMPSGEPIDDIGDFQSCLLGGYLLDMMAQQQIMWPGYYDGADTDHEADALCVVVVVNMLQVPLVKDGDYIDAGEYVSNGKPAVSSLDAMGAISQSTFEGVPAADLDGNCGVAVWGFSTKNFNGEIRFGFSFAGNDPFPGMSIGAEIWNYTERAINLLQGSGQQQNAADTASAASANTPPPQFMWFGASPCVVRAQFVFPDPTNTGILIIFVSAA